MKIDTHTQTASALFIVIVSFIIFEQWTVILRVLWCVMMRMIMMREKMFFDWAVIFAIHQCLGDNHSLCSEIFCMFFLDNVKKKKHRWKQRVVCGLRQPLDTVTKTQSYHFPYHDSVFQKNLGRSIIKSQSRFPRPSLLTLHLKMFGI